MARTNRSVVDMYNSGDWSPTNSTALTTSGASGNWGRVLKATSLTIGDTNQVTITYICKRDGVIFSAGYVYFDYTQELTLSNPPTITLTHKYTDGNSTLTYWLTDVAFLSLTKNEVDLWLNVGASGYSVEYSIESVLQPPITIYGPNLPFVITPVWVDPTYQDLISNNVWLYNSNGDVYNTNVTGRVGINTGESVDTNAHLDVNGNVIFRGLVGLHYPGSDYVFTDSASDLGYDFRVFNQTDSRYRLYLDNVGQLGIDTNAPQNKLHVVGNAQITECVSIGAGNSPNAKLEVRGQGNTHATTALLLKNSDDLDLLRVYDDCVVEVCGKPINGAFNCNDLIFTKVPTPDIENTWTALSNNNSPYNHPDGGTSSQEDYIVAKGAKVSFNGKYRYIVYIGLEEAEPDRIDGDWGTAIPGTGIWSSDLVVAGIETDTTYTVNLYKQKDGLVVENGQVVCPEPGEENTESDSATIKFWDSYYFGYITDATPSNAAVQAIMNDDKYLNSRVQVKTGVDPVGGQYTVYAYPTTLGPLSDVILNGASAVLGAFNLDSSPMTLLNHAGLAVECYVYVTNAPDAFTDDELSFL